ncbi:hypothetical protein IT403_02770 [Candidatus Nomurabacteria bacterium]|nr:hypothetical protein [Candidatus Nomurabacteria bacterium]
MKNILIWSLVTIVFVGGILVLVKKPSGPGKYDQFAQCLADKGAKFYGAFWCPHCQNQKRMFGSKSAKLLPYTECSTPDGKGTTQACIDAGVKSYPTWKFADGTELVGEIPLAQLAEKTSCVLEQPVTETP